MPKMHDALVLLHLGLLSFCCMLLVGCLAALTVYRRKLSRPITTFGICLFVGTILSAILYLLYIGTAANGFLD